MYFCNFAVRIIKQIDENNFEFDVLDKNFFELNKKYFTKDNQEVEIFFILNNELFDIEIPSIKSRILLKKKLLFLDYCSTFTPLKNEFKILKNEINLEKVNTLTPGDVIFIRTNLVSNKF
jgi:hypothetical protein